jgi:hypothetical protein
MIFDIHKYSKEKKIKLVIVEFTDYAMVWWDKLVRIREEMEKDL